MNQSSGGREPGELGYGAWILFWAQLGVLAMLVVLGAAVASKSAAPGDYACGLALSIAAIALGFIRISARFDDAGGRGSSLLVDNMPSLTAVIVVFTVLALVGLFAAATNRGLLHDVGLALFVASAVGVFLNLKNVFDHQDRTR